MVLTRKDWAFPWHLSLPEGTPTLKTVHHIRDFLKNPGCPRQELHEISNCNAVISRLYHGDRAGELFFLGGRISGAIGMMFADTFQLCC